MFFFLALKCVTHCSAGENNGLHLPLVSSSFFLSLATSADSQPVAGSARPLQGIWQSRISSCLTPWPSCRHSFTLLSFLHHSIGFCPLESTLPVLMGLTADRICIAVVVDVIHQRQTVILCNITYLHPNPPNKLTDRWALVLAGWFMEARE